MFGFLKANVFGVPPQLHAKMSLHISGGGWGEPGGVWLDQQGRTISWEWER